jgi:hypothetical protein
MLNIIKDDFRGAIISKHRTSTKHLAGGGDTTMACATKPSGAPSTECLYFVIENDESLYRTYRPPNNNQDSYGSYPSNL